MGSRTKIMSTRKKFTVDEEIALVLASSKAVDGLEQIKDLAVN